MRRAQLLTAAALLALITAAVYLPALGNGFVAYDDDLYITQEPALRGGIGAESLRWAVTSYAGGNWFPLTRMSWLLDASLFGLDPRAFHLTSVGLHALASGVLALALTRQAIVLERGRVVHRSASDALAADPDLLHRLVSVS